MLIAAALAVVLAAVFASPPAAAATLEQEFRHPPEAARPWAYWFFMDGNLSREGITADLEAMKAAGLGGVILMEVDVGIPRGPVKFMSPEWRQLFAHAVRETERLGLHLTLNAGPGWTGSGGPWVKPEQSMQHLVASEVEVTGPSKFNAPLPRPAPRAPYFGSKGLPAELLIAKDAFYVDVAVLAVPKTEKKIADLDEKALYLRHPYTSRPGTKPFLPAPARHFELPPAMVIPTNRVVDLTGRLGPDGRLTWDVPEGQWTILRFGRTSTGANTRPAPAPGLGLECDKFDQAALDAHFEAFVGALLREVGPRRKYPEAGWNMLHIDSWEMGAQNWSGAFREEFHRRRGYDPLPWLPAVTGRAAGSLEQSERFLWDLRQTAQELVIENHARHLKDLGRRHGFGLSIEPYDMNPCADLSLGAVADVPMCEFWLYGFNSFFTVIEAASIAHTHGRPIVAAEAFTSSAAERWQAHPASMKTLGDWAFAAGVNRIVFHRYQHQPELNRRPGMTMGPYGVHWERTQTWWDMVPAYHEYLARCQYLLRRGLPVADVLFLGAEGAPHVFRPPNSAVQGNPPDRRGYNFDAIAPEALRELVSVRDGRLVVPHGMSYRVLVLPERDTMTPALLRKVRDLVQAGATVIGPRPEKSPSLSGYPQCDAEVQKIADELWGKESRERRQTGFPLPCEIFCQADTGHSTSQFVPKSLSLGERLPRKLVSRLATPEPRRSRRKEALISWPSRPGTNLSLLTSAPTTRGFMGRELPSPIPVANESSDFSERQFGKGRIISAKNPAATASADSPNPLERAKWIWFNEGRPAASAPVARRFFRRTLVLEANARVESARVFMTADNSFELWVNGQRAGGGDNFHEICSLDIAAKLRPGTNVIAVLAENGGETPNPAGLIGAITIRLQGGGLVEVVTDRTWLSSAQAAGPWKEETGTLPNGGDSLELGPMRMAPWNLTGKKTTADPEQYGDFSLVTAALERLGVPPDFESDGPLRYAHRQEGTMDIYFVANREERPVEAVGVFRVTGKAPELWDPLTGEVRPLPDFKAQAGRTTVPLRFEPAQSFFIVFRQPGRSGPGPNFPAPATPLLELAGPWEVSFDPQWGGPEKITFETLTDWSKRPEEGIRFYSGLATYRHRFTLPASAVGPGRSASLDLGVVKNLARVRLNGKDLGVVWCAPWQVDLAPAARAGENELEIVVANLWPNRLIGDQSLPPEKRLTSTTWNPFKKDSPLLESGLLGPVTVKTSEQ